MTENENAHHVGTTQIAMAGRFELIQQPLTEYEDYYTPNRRMSLSFGSSNGGRYAYYDGGSATMSVRGGEPEDAARVMGEVVTGMALLREEISRREANPGDDEEQRSGSA